MPEHESEELQQLAAALTPRERKFVHEYLVDLNGKDAAIRAGYSEKTAASQASRLLRKPEVKAYRDALLKEHFDAIGITKHSIAAATWEIYQKCCQKEPVLEWDSVTKAWVPSGYWQFNVKGALKALEMLAKLLPEMGGGDAAAGSLEDLLSGGGGREF